MNDKQQQLLYMICDFFGVALAVLLFNIYRRSILSPFSTLADYLSSTNVIIGQILFPVLMMGIFYISGFYSSPFRRSRMQDVFTTFGSCIAGTLLIVFTALVNDLSTDRGRDYTMFLVLFAILFTCVMIPRALITGITAKKLRNGELFTPVIIVGYTKAQADILKQLRQLKTHLGFRPVAIAALDNPAVAQIGSLPVYDIANINKLIKDKRVTHLILVRHPSGSWEQTLPELGKLMPLGLPILTSHTSKELGAVHHLDVASEPLINVTGIYVSPFTANVKRMFDVVVSSLALIIGAIPIGMLAIAVKLNTPGKAFYRQTRLGRGGKPFQIIKLRTMREDAEKDGEPMLSSLNDSRITSLGQTLRKYRLDEFPQFWNVLKGEMSIVGPRPERPYYVDKIVKINPQYVLLHQVRPGITSWGMVKYGYASKIEEMIERMRYDVLYLHNVSLLLDLKIIFYTFNTVFTGKGL